MFSDDSINTLLKKANGLLADISDSSRLDSELLLAHALDKNRSYLFTWPEKELNPKQLDYFHSLIEKRLSDYPVAYLLGKKSFWTLDLIVTPDVLIPRPETELLVEIALEKIANIRAPKILDLGTGSGAIALALASERQDASITATDNSKQALLIAKKNAEVLNLGQQVLFVESYWLSNITEKDFDLVISNPPYIDPEDSHLQGTIRHEPIRALVANDHGMQDIQTIIKESHPLLKKGGWLILEHGFDQSKKTLTLLEKYHYQENKSVKDLNNNWRTTMGCKAK